MKPSLTTCNLYKGILGCWILIFVWMKLLA
jgi:hypothetical protein